MSEKSLPNNRDPANAAIRDLIGELLQEPFAAANSLGTLSLKDAAKLFEGERFSESGALDEGLAESFEKCRSVYCLLIMELENRGITEEEITSLQEWSSTAPTEVTEVHPPELPPLPGAKPPANKLSKAPPLPKTGKPRPEPPPAKIPETEDSHLNLSGPPKEYVRIAQYFQSWLEVTSPPFAAEYVERLIGQNLSFALESQCHRTLHAGLERFWGQRRAAIKALLAPDADENSQFALSPILRNDLDQLSERHRFWLGDKTFPYPVVLLALRYIFARPRAEDFTPSLTESAVLLLFFGNPGPLGDWQLGNELGAHGLSVEETLELSFRLIHLQRVRNLLLIPTSPLPDANQRKILSQELRRTLHLMSAVTLGNYSRNAA
jgi:hypothetical protein